MPDAARRRTAARQPMPFQLAMHADTFTSKSEMTYVFRLMSLILKMPIYHTTTMGFHRRHASQMPFYSAARYAASLRRRNVGAEDTATMFRPPCRAP